MTPCAAGCCRPALARGCLWLIYQAKAIRWIQQCPAGEKPASRNYSGTRPVGGLKPKGEDLWPVGAFEGFVHGPHGDRAGDANGVPDELVLGGFARWTTITLGSGADLNLVVGSVRIENDTIGGAFRNLAHIIFDSDTQ